MGARRGHHGRLGVFTTTIRRWLKCGVVELGERTASEAADAGTPQGGIISPLLANIALDGMEREFGCEKADETPRSPAHRKGANKGINLIRYADDFVVTAPSREVLERYVTPKIRDLLGERGLRLSEAKTRVVHVDEGFGFLGFEIRRLKGKLLTRPREKDKVIAHLRGGIKDYLNGHKQTPAVEVIRTLGLVIRGWSNYYRHGTANRTFTYASHRTWEMLWVWAKRRHHDKPSKWVKERYFKADGYWTFHEGSAKLYRHSATPITRYVKVRGRSSPMDPDQREYWEERKKRAVTCQTLRKEKRAMLREQGNACGLCGVTFLPGDPRSTSTTSNHANVAVATRGRIGRLLTGGATTRTTRDTGIQGTRGLSRMTGDRHVRFLGGGIAAMRSRYPTGVATRWVVIESVEGTVQNVVQWPVLFLEEYS